jgi:prevent-host-death family protein
MLAVAAKDARARFSELLDKSARSESVLIIRNSKPAAMLVPHELGRLLPMLQVVLAEVDATLQQSGDQALLAELRSARVAADDNDVSWYGL